MKRFTVVLLLTLVAAGTIFAEGSQEKETQRPGPGFGPGQVQEAPETVNLTGTIQVSVFPPVLTAEGVEYKVMVPPWAAADISLKDGQEITLEGFVDDDCYGRFGNIAEGDHVLMVTKAIIEGEEYELDMPGRHDFDDRRGGMMSNNRPRGRW